MGRDHPFEKLHMFGEPLAPDAIEEWVKRGEREFTACFGGATSLRAPGTNIVGGKVLYEAGQVLVVSGCNNRAEFLRHRDRIDAFATEMGDQLDQAAVFVLAFDSDSFLVELGGTS